MKVGSWPGPEILAIKLITENQPFDPTSHEKFRCTRHGQVMADRGNSIQLPKGVESVLETIRDH